MKKDIIGIRIIAFFLIGVFVLGGSSLWGMKKKAGSPISPFYVKGDYEDLFELATLGICDSPGGQPEVIEFSKLVDRSFEKLRERAKACYLNTFVNEKDLVLKELCAVDSMRATQALFFDCRITDEYLQNSLGEVKKSLRSIGLVDEVPLNLDEIKSGESYIVSCLGVRSKYMPRRLGYVFKIMRDIFARGGRVVAFHILTGTNGHKKPKPNQYSLTHLRDSCLKEYVKKDRWNEVKDTDWVNNVPNEREMFKRTFELLDLNKILKNFSFPVAICVKDVTFLSCPELRKNRKGTRLKANTRDTVCWQMEWFSDVFQGAHLVYVSAGDAILRQGLVVKDEIQRKTKPSCYKSVRTVGDAFRGEFNAKRALEESSCLLYETIKQKLLKCFKKKFGQYEVTFEMIGEDEQMHYDYVFLVTGLLFCTCERLARLGKICEKGVAIGNLVICSKERKLNPKFESFPWKNAKNSYDEQQAAAYILEKTDIHQEIKQASCDFLTLEVSCDQNTLAALVRNIEQYMGRVSLKKDASILFVL